VILNRLGKYVDLETSGLRDLLDSLPASASRLLFAVGTALVEGLATFAGEALITFFILFFIFRDGASTADQLTTLLPLSPEQSHRLFSRIRESVVANLYGMLAVSIIQGLLTGIALVIVGVPSPLLWGTAAAVFSLVPIVGSALVWLPIAIFLFAGGHWWKGIFFLAWEAILIGLADNVVRPLVLVGRVRLHPLLLLFALVGGVRQFGFIGLFVGPVVISIIFALIEMLREEIGNGGKETQIA
jgi:predicted PurR-regulated permease PerM